MNRSVVGLATLTFLAGCQAGPSADLPTHPPVPAGWTAVEKAGLRMALPPEWPVKSGQDDGIVVDVGVGDPNVFLLAQAPANVEPQPGPSASAAELTDWILDRVSTRRPDRYTSANALLPAGPAVVVRYRFDGEAGSFEAVEGVGWAITSPLGVAYLQINMSESLLAEFEEAMAEVPFHLSLAGGTG